VHGVALAEGAMDAIAHPERALARVREAAEGIGEIIWAGLNPAPETPLNVPIGPHRRFVGVTSQLSMTSRRSRTRSAAPSTTWCSPSSPAPCARS
jgi:hypothetical protein